MSLLIIFIILSFLSLSIAEDRPHGFPGGTPSAISPEEYKFFHPDLIYPKVVSPSKSKAQVTMPLAATVKSTPAQESVSATPGGHEELGAGCIAGVSLSFVFVCIVGMGAYVVIIRRRVNFHRANAKHDLA